MPWKYAGKSLLAIGQVKKAQQCFTNAHQLDTSDPEVANDIGNTFLNLGNKDAAAQWYESSLGADNNYAHAINNLANLKRQNGNNQEAVVLFKRAIQVDPQLIQAYVGAAASLLAMSDLDQAEAFATHAIEIGTRVPGANEILGIIFQNKKNRQKAVESFQKELAINPKSIVSLLNAGILLIQHGESCEAIDLLIRAKSILPSEQCSLLLAQAYQNTKQYEEAIAEYRGVDVSKSQNKAIPFNLGLCLLNNSNNHDAIEAFKIAIKLDNSCFPAWANIGIALMNEGRHDEALPVIRKALDLEPNNPGIHMNLGGIYRDLGNLDQALASTLKSLELKPDNPDAHNNLVGIYKDLGNLDQALASTLKALELKPDNPTAYMNLGSIYHDLGNLDQALASTLKSLELKNNNPTAYMNLGSIYHDLGNLDQALASTLKSVELKPNNPGASNNINIILEHIKLSPTNAENITRAYEFLLSKTNVSHKKYAKIFLQIFLSTIQKATTSDPILSEDNEALKTLISDWRFLKSLTLMIPPSPEIERFLTRLRKELLNLAIQKGAIPQQLIPLTESLAVQCFLNEYIYETSQEENKSIPRLIEMATNSQESCSQYLAILSCYRAIHTIEISSELISNYPTPDDSSKALIASQFIEPHLEKEIKASFPNKHKITNSISKRVKEMYEENPYPRFKFSDYTDSKQAKPIHKFIEIEVGRKNLTFLDELKSLSATPKVLIAGCGTGNQVIIASRYKNAQITAIDLSSSSLAYAIRKAKEYEMNNVAFKNLDLLNVADLYDMFDIIVCSGVLHHMAKPYDGLSALIQQLKPDGYIKIGLYSEIARAVIVKARKTIQRLGINSTPEDVRNFRRKVLDGEFNELKYLHEFGSDFYSLSECRDLCFHVQEHRFTTEKLDDLLDSNGLNFCGFMLKEEIKKIYQAQYPEDINMTSLSNWGKFEEEHPLTFAGMYQFWAQKSS